MLHYILLSLDKNANTSWFYLMKLVTRSTIDLGMYDHLIFCIHCNNNVLNNDFGRQDALAGNCLIRTGFLPNYETIEIFYLTKLQYNFLGRG